MTLSRRARHLVSAGVLLIVAACSGSDATETQAPPPPATDRLTVVLTPDRDSILMGTTRQFTARVTNQFGLERSVPVEWTSTNASVASVTSTGLVTAVGAGSVQVIARVTGHADTSLVTVHGSAVPLQIVPDQVSLLVGDDITLQASMGDSVAGAGGTVEWTSSDTTLATVSTDGTVTGYQEGEVTLTATLSGSTALAKVSVLAPPVATITITPTVNSIAAGSTVTLTATAYSSTGAVIQGVQFTWSTSDVNVASVNANGVVRGKTRGFAIISAAAQGKRGSVSVNVGPPPVSSVVATMPDSSILEGQVLDAVATALDSAGRPIAGATIAWQSSNPAIATVTSAGRVTALVAGNVSIIALSGSKTGSIPVVVSKRTATSLAITPAQPAVGLGSTMQLTANVLDQNGQPISGPTITWSSGNTAIATVSASGVLTGVSLGQADITATSGSLVQAVRAQVGAAAVATVVLNPQTAQLFTGDALAFSPTLKDAQGNVLSGRTITWASSDPAVATVSATGVATGIAAGNATITATSEGKSGSATLTVKLPAPASVASVNVTLNSSALSVGQTTQAAATALDSQGTPVSGATFTWTSADPAIATVAANGVVTAVAGGTTTIIATSGGVSGAASLTVATSAPASIATISVVLNPAALGTGNTSQATVTLRDSAGNVLTGRSYGLSSDKPTIATVNTSGLVTAIAAGLTNIRATSGTKMGYALLTVTSTAPTVASVSVSAATTTMNVGDTQQATATARDAAGNSVGGQSFTWVSSAPSVISVSSSGLLTALAAGSATITATAAGISGSLGFTAQVATANPVASVQFTLGSPTLSSGQTTQGVAVLKDAQGNVLTGRTITYSSSNTAVATVSTSGLVSAIAVGSATITATSGGVSGSANLTVTQPVVASVTVTLASTLSVGQTATAVVILKDAGGKVLTGLPISYSSSNTSVATVSAAGLVTALAAGSANIVAASGGVTGSAPVTVQSALPAAAAALPRAVPSIPSGLASLACTVSVPAGGLQSALNAARGGAVLCLTGTHTGNFTVPARTDAGWVVVRSASTIPAGRMRPSLAGGLAKIVSPNTLSAIQFRPRAVRTMVLGVEITSVSTNATGPVALVEIGTGTESTVPDLPTDIVFQQVYIHGWSNQDLRRAFAMNGGAQTLRDSWCSEIHIRGFDSQCTIAWNSSGPILIENNTLQAASENIMFGGADPAVPGLVAADVTVRRNHIAKPLAWQGAGWNVKNLVETKASARVLIEENVLEGAWTDGQVGYAFVLKSSTQNGGCKPCSSSDWTIRRNLVRNVGAGFSLAGRADAKYGAGPPDSTNRRFDISENWIEPINVAPYTGDSRPIIFVEENEDFVVRRNVFEGGGNSVAVIFDISGGKSAARNLTMASNVLNRGQYGLLTSSTAEGAPSWTKGAVGSSVWSTNALVGSTSATYPSGTQFYSSVSAAVSAGQGVARTVIDAGVNGVVVSP